jgi:hypothetical protein
MPRIQDLPPAASSGATDAIPCDQTDGITRKATPAQIATAGVSGGATGSIVYRGASGLAAAPDFVYSGGKVGVGTPTPGAELEVYKASGESAIHVNSGNSVSAVRLLKGGVPKWSLLCEYPAPGLLSFLDVATVSVAMVIKTGGMVGIGVESPDYRLQLSTDSAAKPGTSTWTVASDPRLKRDITEADLARCYAIVRALKLKHFRWRDDMVTPDQVSDRGQLGWIANDVEAVFPKAVRTYKHEGPEKESAELETYQEPVYEERTVTEDITDIEIRDGKAVQVKRQVTRTERVPVYEDLPIVTPDGQPVLDEHGQPSLHRVQKMVIKTRPKKVRQAIEDCKAVDSDQILKALYGAVQHLMQMVETLEARIANLEGSGA